jgi:hypothetical protein
MLLVEKGDALTERAVVRVGSSGVALVVEHRVEEEEALGRMEDEALLEVVGDWV